MSLYEAGCTTEEILQSELRHLLMRQRGYENRKRRENAHVIGLRNEVRGFLGADPIDPYSSSTQQQSTDKSEAARHAMLRQMDLGTDREATPEDLQSLQ